MTQAVQTAQYGSSNVGLSFKNRVINGNMVIDQRNAGASVVLDGNGVYPVDRWRCDEATDGAATGQQVQDAPNGFVNSLKFTTTTADSSLAAGQYMAANHFVEGFNTADFNWGTANTKTFTLSFWVKSSLTGTFAGGVDNNSGNRSYVFNYTINAANTWEYKTVTIVGDTSGTWETTNQRGIGLRFGLGSGSSFEGTVNSWQSGSRFSSTGAVSVIGTLNATWQITGVQLEVGSTATSFDYRSYGTELALCQRYYQALSGLGWVQGQASRDTATQSYHGVIYRVPMRGVPTGSVTDSTSNSLNRYGPGGEYYFGENAASVLSFAAYYNNSVTLTCTLAGATTFESKAILLGNNATIRLSAEL